jgi:hypothetical protein
MADDQQRRLGWRERRKVARRAKHEHSGDSPEKQREHPTPPEYDAKDVADRTAGAGFISGGFGGSAG